jgi:hypothetical protein
MVSVSQKHDRAIEIWNHRTDELETCETCRHCNVRSRLEQSIIDNTKNEQQKAKIIEREAEENKTTFRCELGVSIYQGSNFDHKTKKGFGCTYWVTKI